MSTKSQKLEKTSKLVSEAKRHPGHSLKVIRGAPLQGGVGSKGVARLGVRDEPADLETVAFRLQFSMCSYRKHQQYLKLQEREISTQRSAVFLHTNWHHRERKPSHSKVKGHKARE